MRANVPTKTNASARLQASINRARRQMDEFAKASIETSSPKNEGAGPPLTRTGAQAVRFPNAAAALRQYVATTLEEAGPRVRIQRLSGEMLAPTASPHPSTSRAKAIVKHARAARSSNLDDLAPAARDVTSQVLVASANTLGALVRLQRRHQQLSQQALADLAGVGRRFVVELEAGKESVELGRALKVCAALHLNLFADVHQ